MMKLTLNITQYSLSVSVVSNIDERRTFFQFLCLLDVKKIALKFSNLDGSLYRLLSYRLKFP